MDHIEKINAERESMENDECLEWFYKQIMSIHAGSIVSFHLDVSNKETISRYPSAVEEKLRFLNKKLDEYKKKNYPYHFGDKH